MMGPGTRTGTLGAAGCDAARRHGGGANGDSSAALSAATSASGCTSFFDYPRKWVGTAARFPEGFTLATHNVQAAGTRGGGVRRSERAPLEKCLRDLVEGEYSVLCLQEMQRCKRCESKPAAVLPSHLSFVVVTSLLRRADPQRNLQVGARGTASDTNLQAAP